MNIEPIVLDGEVVRMEPMGLEHHKQLCEVGLDGDLWRYSPNVIQTPDDMQKYIESALRDRDAGVALPFATVERSTGRAIGSSRFGNIDRTNLRVEIGWTWIAKDRQRTRVNTEAKYLMLRHAFEELGCNRVEFKTDSLNERSRNAILRIGATQEGIFRNHMVMPGGRLRHSVYFSIINSEWPTVKNDLEEKLRLAG
jgi:RimJ/RimL family protein N-acetyltransferase